MEEIGIMMENGMGKEKVGMDAFIFRDRWIGSRVRSYIHGKELSVTKPTILFASMR